MIIQQYAKYRDKTRLERLLKSRNMSADNIKSLPKLGWLVYFSALQLNTGIPMAAGFIRKLEGKCWLLEGYIQIQNIRLNLEM